MLKQGLILQIINWTDHCAKEKNEKITGVMKNKSG